jgi:hypothetical protein
VNRTSEQWRPVVGYEGLYEVSDHGRVRSLDRHFDRRGHPVRVWGRVMRLSWSNRGGYPTVGLCRDGKQRTWNVHRLVMEAFVGPMPAGMEIRHIDGNPANACLVNLQYGSSSDNKWDQVRHGTHHESRVTHCPQGHPYDEANTYVLPSRPRARYCRSCARDRRRAA